MFYRRSSLLSLCNKAVQHYNLPQTSKQNVRFNFGRNGGMNSRRQGQKLRSKVNQRMDKPSSEFAPETSGKPFKLRPLSDLWKPAVFTVGFSSTCFIGAAVWEQERLRRKKDSFFDLKNWGYRPQKQGPGRNEINEWWNNLTDAQKALVALIALNGGVFAMWRSTPVLGRFMLKYFTNGFHVEKLCSPLLLSTFSHYGAVHFGLNMFVLYSFGSQVIDKFLGIEQFTAMYLSAGVISSFVGITHKASLRSPVAALGASGAILGLLTYSCMKMPDARLSIIFLPFFTFSASAAVYGIICFDSLGLVLGWRMFDHAAHLGGSLFGLWYAKYGENAYAKLKPQIAKYWREIVDTKSPDK